MSKEESCAAGRLLNRKWLPSRQSICAHFQGLKWFFPQKQRRLSRRSGLIQKEARRQMPWRQQLYFPERGLFILHIEESCRPPQPINVNSFKPRCVFPGAKPDFLEGCPDGSKMNLKQFLWFKRGRKILQRDTSGLQAKLHEFNFHFLKLGPQN